MLLKQLCKTAAFVALGQKNATSLVTGFKMSIL